MLAGLPVEVAGITVNRLCASGLAAVVDASRAIQCGQGDLFIAGGVENMSRSPFVMAKAEQAYGRDVAVFDTALGSRFQIHRWHRSMVIMRCMRRRNTSDKTLA